MAQIIKHRRGSIDSVKTTTTRNGEVLIASGSISDLAGPFVFVGSPVERLNQHQKYTQELTHPQLVLVPTVLF